MSGGSVGRILRVCTTLAAIHSLLVSKPAKDLARRIAGHRYRNGLYRLFFNTLSVLCLAWAAQWFLRLPDREIYRVGAPWSWLFRAGQVASLGVLLSAVRVIGVLDFAGVSQLRSFLAGLDPDPESEAQELPLGVDGQMVTARVFRFTRHPSNLGALEVCLLFPRITVNRVTLVVLVALYVVLGSLHEERRLRAAYGEPFGQYRREVPFLVPRLRRGKNLLTFHRHRCRYRANIRRLAPRTHLRYRVDLSRPADRESRGTAVTALMADAS